MHDNNNGSMKTASKNNGLHFILEFRSCLDMFSPPNGLRNFLS